MSASLPTPDPAREAAELAERWRTDPRWQGIERPYEADDVIRLRGSIRVAHTLARLGAERLWRLLQRAGYVRALGAMTGGQAVQMVRAGLEAIYVLPRPASVDRSTPSSSCGR